MPISRREWLVLSPWHDHGSKEPNGKMMAQGSQPIESEKEEILHDDR